MADIYEQHKAAFANVSAYVVTDGTGERVATVAFKFPRDGAGRLFCYFHVFGTQMVRAYASGGGYDKRSAAAHSAVRKIVTPSRELNTKVGETINAVQNAIKDAGYDWARELENSGFTVMQAV